jgi:hypothetical protein
VRGSKSIDFIHNTTVSDRRTGAAKKKGLVELLVTLMLGLRGALIFSLTIHVTFFGLSSHQVTLLLILMRVGGLLGGSYVQRQSFDQVGVLHTWFAGRACPANVFFSNMFYPGTGGVDSFKA